MTTEQLLLLLVFLACLPILMICSIVFLSLISPSLREEFKKEWKNERDGPNYD